MDHDTVEREALAPPAEAGIRLGVLLNEIEYGRHHGWPSETLQRLESISDATRAALAARGAAPQGEPDTFTMTVADAMRIVDANVTRQDVERAFAANVSPVVGSAGAAPQQGGGGVPAGEAEAFEVWLKEARELAAESTKQAILHQFAIDDPDISESALDSARDATTKATAKFHAHLRQRAAAPSTPAAANTGE